MLKYHGVRSFFKQGIANLRENIGPAIALPAQLSKLDVNSPPGNTVHTDALLDAQGNIVIDGTDNEVSFGANTKFKGSIEIRGKNNRVLFGPGSVMRGRIVVKGNNQTVSIGEQTTFQSAYLLCHEGCDITIGRWCMFSRDIEIRTTDAHSVVEKSTGLRLNAPASVVIGDHVWVSVGVFISKGVQLAADTIVGANAFVNGQFAEEGTMLAGAPARVVKRDVTWHRSRKRKFSSEELSAWRIDESSDEDAVVDEE